MTGLARRADPWPWVLVGAGVIVFVLQGFDGVLVRDLALYAYSGQQVAEGVPPYVGVLNRAGPLAHVVPGVGVWFGRVLGADDVLAMRVTLMLVSLGCVWLTYLAARSLYRSRATGALAAATLLAFPGFVTYATGGPREKTTMVLFLLLVVLATAHRAWLTAGAAVALATLCLQIAFPPAFACAAVAALFLPPWRDRIRALGAVVGGGVLVTLVTVVGFALTGALPELIEGFLTVNLSHTSQLGIVETLRRDPLVLVNSFGFHGTVLMVLGVVGMMVVAARPLPTARDAAARGATVGAAAGAAATLGWSLLAFQDWPDAFPTLPYAALGLAGLASLVVTSARIAPRRVIAAAAVLVLVLAAVSSARTSPVGLTNSRERALQMLALGGPEASVQSVGAPAPLVFGRLENPSRHQMFRNGLDGYLDEELPQGLAGFAEDVSRRQPTFVTVDEPSAYAWLQPTLESEYIELGRTGPGFTWFVHRTTPGARVDRMRDLIEVEPEVAS